MNSTMWTIAAIVAYVGLIILIVRKNNATTYKRPPLTARQREYERQWASTIAALKEERENPAKLIEPDATLVAAGLSMPAFASKEDYEAYLQMRKLGAMPVPEVIEHFGERTVH